LKYRDRAALLVCLVAVAGLLFFRVEGIVSNTLLQGIGINRGSHSGTNLRPVRLLEDVGVVKMCIYDNKFLAVENLLLQLVVYRNGFFLPRIVVSRELEAPRQRGLRRDSADVKSIECVPLTELTDMGFLALLKHGRNIFSTLNDGWRFAAIDNVERDGNGVNNDSEVNRNRNDHPSSLIHAHGLAHVVRLGEVGNKGEDGYEDGRIHSPVSQKSWRIVCCLCHVIVGLFVGMLLTRGFRNNYVGGRWLRCFLFLALVFVSAAHVVIYLFRLTDAF
jgi:hypothetical protein